MEEVNFSGGKALAIVLIAGLIGGFGINNVITQGPISALRSEISELEHEISDLQLELEAYERITSMNISSIRELLSNPAFYHGKKVIAAGTVASYNVTDPSSLPDYQASLLVRDAYGDEISVRMIGRGEGISSYEGFRAVIIGIFYADLESGNHVLDTHVFSVIVLD